MITVNFFKHSFYEKGLVAFLEDVGEEYKEKNPNAYERWAEEKKKSSLFTTHVATKIATQWHTRLSPTCG